MILSYEAKLRKPDIRIYRKAADLLGVSPKECVFVGDGGSNELPGARAAGMEAIQAKWYTNELPHRRDSLPGFLTAEEPFDILRYFEKRS